VLVLSQDVTERERNEQMQRDLIANASHELKTPLTVISGTIETLQSARLDPASQQRMTATMAAQTSRMQAIIEDLLTLAEIEGKAAPSMEDWVGVAELVDESLHRAAAAFGSRMRLSVAADCARQSRRQCMPALARGHVGADRDWRTGERSLANFGQR
jgi:two-component system phosphate regulon sensor histidine kinase PhoR